MQRTKVILDIDNAIGMPVRDVDDGIALGLILKTLSDKICADKTTSSCDK